MNKTPRELFEVWATKKRLSLMRNTHMALRNEYLLPGVQERFEAFLEGMKQGKQKPGDRDAADAT